METCENGKKIWERSRSVLGRFYCTKKLEFGASVGFILKESLTMHGHTIIKFTII